jgi:hypothetical protein
MQGGKLEIMLFVLLLIAVYEVNARSGYIYYPFAPNALYQSAMNVSFVSGRSRYFQEEAGFGSQGSYNGVLGITFDETEKWGFLTSADGKKVRKLNQRTTYLPPDITSSSYRLYHLIV